MFKFFKMSDASEDNTASFGPELNRLQRYIQSQSVKDLSRVVSSINPEAKQIVALNVQALLGYLPSGEFNTVITTNKENLQNLLASAMLTGYFIHMMEQRMLMDELYQESPAVSPEVPEPTSDEKGQFMSTPELLEQLKKSPDLSVQLEINTNFDLDSFLNAVRFLQQRSDKENS